MKVELTENNIPEGWIKLKLSEVALLNMGQSPPSDTYNLNGVGLPFFQGKTDFGDYSPTPRMYCSEPVKIAKTGDVLISVRAPVGPTNLANDDCCIGRGLAGLTALGGISNKYLLYQLRSIEHKIAELGSGSTFKAISKENLGNLEILVAPQKEQYKIIIKLEELFSELDHSIRNLQLAQAQLKVYRQAILKNAFEGKLTKNWRKENNPEPAEKLLEKIKEERQTSYNLELKEWKAEIKKWEKSKKQGKKPRRPKSPKNLVELSNTSEYSNLPSNWKWIKIGDFEGFIGSGSTPKGGRNVYVEKGIPFIRSMNIHPNRLVSEGLVYISEETHSKMKRSRAKEKDVLLNITGASIGRCACLPEGFGHANVNQHVCIIRPFTKRIDNKYLCHYLNSPEAQKIIKKINSGATREALTFEQVRNFPFPLTSIIEQEFIISELESKISIIDELEDSIRLRCNSIEILRQSILKKAFSGELVDQNPNNEPTTSLLERIQEEKKKYLEEQKFQKGRTLKKANKMKKPLIQIIEDNFHDNEFSYIQLKAKCKFSYEELRTQLFELIDSNKGFKSRFDESLNEIKYSLRK